MRVKWNGVRAATLAVAALWGSMSADAGAAFLYWSPPNFSGPAVRGDEPGIQLPLPSATPKELDANLLWSMRAGLNVAALQCQFSPALMTVRNYNEVLKHHGKELAGAYTTISAYFKRVGGKTWQTQLDQYTTRTYNGYSTLYAQIGFCETAGSIGRDALARRKGDLHLTAESRMREFRNSLVPAEDGIFLTRAPVLAARKLPSLDAACWDGKNRLKKKCDIAA